MCFRGQTENAVLLYIFFYIYSYLGTDYIADVIREKVAVVNASKYFMMLFIIAARLSVEKA